MQDVAVEHPEASGRFRATNRLRIVGAVNAIERIAEIDRFRAERIVQAAEHTFRQFGFALTHLGRRIPIGPIGNARHLLTARPRETVSADTDRINKRRHRVAHEIKFAATGINHDGAGRITARERRHFRRDRLDNRACAAILANWLTVRSTRRLRWAARFILTALVFDLVVGWSTA